MWQEHTSYLKSVVLIDHTVAGIHHLLKDSIYARTLVWSVQQEKTEVLMFTVVMEKTEQSLMLLNQFNHVLVDRTIPLACLRNN